jgi:preprotein translocase subunit SecF
MISISILIAALMAFLITGFTSSSLSNGFKLSQDFTGGTKISVVPLEGYDFISSVDAEAIKKDLITRGLEENNIQILKEANKIIAIKFNSIKTFVDAGD